MKYTPQERWFLEQRDAPELEGAVLPEHPLLWRAFQSLKGVRSIGMGVGAIPPSEIRAWMDEAQIRGLIQRHRVMTVVQAMDTVYLEEISRRKGP